MEQPVQSNLTPKADLPPPSLYAEENLEDDESFAINWDQLVEEWDNSNLTQKQFCQKRKINLNTFIYHRSKQLNKIRENRSLIPLTVTNTSNQVQDRDCVFVLQLNCGTKLMIPDKFNEASLKKLFTLLDIF